MQIEGCVLLIHWLLLMEMYGRNGGSSGAEGHGMPRIYVEGTVQGASRGKLNLTEP
jgi:hypothetical protein